jgi:parvulin-like peptidyl-prolyl isomerase
MRRKLLVSLLVISIVGTVAFVLWKIQTAKAKAVRRESETLRSLSQDQLVMILRSQASLDLGRTNEITATEQSRKAFLSSLTEFLSLAASARREGLADDPNYELSVRLKAKGLLADLYYAKLVSETKQAYAIPKEKVDAVWANSENEQQFQKEIAALQSVQEANAASLQSSSATTAPLRGEGLEKAKASWARALILSEMAEADGQFMQQEVVQLRLRLLSAGVLSTSYLAKYWSSSIKATRDEIAVYLASHPELDTRKKLELAKTVLMRARRGDDFAALANEFSEDRATKKNGGLYENYDQGGGLWPEVENAALQLKPGEIAASLVESRDGYHVVQLVRTATVLDEVTAKPKTKVSLRHILIQRRFEDPTVDKTTSPIPPPFRTGEEIAKAAIEKMKRRNFVEQVVAREKIELPSDFQFSN